jgi:hypothetical protein
MGNIQLNAGWHSRDIQVNVSGHSTIIRLPNLPAAMPAPGAQAGDRLWEG